MNEIRSEHYASLSLYPITLGSSHTALLLLALLVAVVVDVVDQGGTTRLMTG